MASQTSWRLKTTQLTRRSPAAETTTAPVGKISQGKKEYKKDFEELIAKRFRVEQIPVGGILKLSTYADDGVEIIKKLLKDIEKIKNAKIAYLGAGAYRINIESDDVKKDEKLLDERIEYVLEEIKKHDGTGSFTKEAAEE